jgi:hypothetical protein
VGNRAAADRYGSMLTPAQQRLAAGLLLLAPHVPLLFMGQEYGEPRPFHFFCSYLDPQFADAVRRGRRQRFQAANHQGELPDPQAAATFFDSKVTWSWAAGSWQAGLRRLYCDLIAARRRWPVLSDFQTRSAELLSCGEGGPIICLHRGPNDVAVGRDSSLPSCVDMGRLEACPTANDRNRLAIYFNLSDRFVDSFAADPSDHVLLLASESARFGGPRADADQRLGLFPWEFVALISRPSFQARREHAVSNT